MTSDIFPKGALTHHLVVASCISFALPQAAGLAHSAAPPLPTKQALRGPLGGGIPPVGRAVRSSRSIHRMFLQRGQTMPPSLWAPVIIACASGRQLSPCLPLRCKPLSSAGTTCHPPAKTCHSTRHALRVRQLYRSYGRCIPSTVHFLLSRQKKQNRPLQGAERK